MARKYTGDSPSLTGDIMLATCPTSLCRPRCCPGCDVQGAVGVGCCSDCCLAMDAVLNLQWIYMLLMRFAWFTAFTSTHTYDSAAAQINDGFANDLYKERALLLSLRSCDNYDTSTTTLATSADDASSCRDAVRVLWFLARCDIGAFDLRFSLHESVAFGPCDLEITSMTHRITLNRYGEHIESVKQT